MTATNTTNGKAPPRKQLSDQLDRLDGIIDALAEGLNAAVADACREGARAAVREVLMELISNPDLMSAVRVTATPANPTENDGPSALRPPTQPSFWGRVKNTAKQCGTAVTGAARTMVKSVEHAIQPVTDAVRLTGNPRRFFATVVCIALAAGLVGLVCPVWMSAAVAAGGGAVAVGAAYIRSVMERILARFQLA
jgi:hypothetical protein